MALDPRTPVLVGVGVATQRSDDPTEGVEAIELMAQAAQAADEDCGASLAKRADWIAVPKGTWSYSDPGHYVAQRVGADHAKTTLAEVGILQTTLMCEAASRVASGELDVALVVGGEAKFRSLRTQIAGIEVPDTDQRGQAPDELRVPGAELMEAVEFDRDIVWPVRQYAVVENALRHHRGQSIPDHLVALSELWADFSAVAATNPDAWRREPLSAEALRSDVGNRMLSWPYAKLHNSQWNVDQAAALLFTTVATARSAGIPRDKWIFPLSGADSNFMTTLTSRADLHRSPGFQVAGNKALSAAGLAVEEITHLNLYSCFPIAVQVQAAEMGIALDRQLTVSGGMAFAGGPLNNYVFMAMARIAELLRTEGGTAMATAVSGFLTKQGVSIWGAEPPTHPFAHHDVSETARTTTELRPVDADYRGPVSVAGYTVVFEDNAPSKLIAVCDTPEGRRTVGTATDADVCRSAMAEEFTGTSARLDGAGKLDV